jgi:glutamate formiminotransferase/formiminotetrahydrofolate cyclodeaminase
MNAFSLPKSNEAEKKARTEAIQSATKDAIEVPFKVMQLSLDSMEIVRAMAEKGNPNSVSDAGVGALCARSAVMGAYLNVKINASGLTDKSYVEDILKKGSAIQEKAMKMEKEILDIVNSKIG